MSEKKLAVKRAAKEEVFKHSAAIHIENNITFLQRKTWNALLWNAYNELHDKEVHSIEVQKLMQLVGYDSKDDQYLKDSTKAMLHCIVEWNILDKDGSIDWGATALLAQVRIYRGVCTYAYSHELRQRLHNPSMYARLDLSLQRRFDSKYALSLWEVCIDSLGAKRDYGETSWIAVDKFRKLMGLSGGIYQDFRDLSKRVINCALNEINVVSDFRVEVEYQRKGRKVTALKFKMRRIDVSSTPIANQGTLFPDLDDMPIIVKELTDAGLAMHDAFEVWQKGFKFVDEAARPTVSGEDEDTAFTLYVREKIHLLKRRIAAGKVENSTGFLREAIKKNYANPEFDQEDKRQKVVAAQRDAQVRARQKQQLEEQLNDLKAACDKALNVVRSEIAATIPDVLEVELKKVIADNSVMSALYKPNRSALENYYGSPFLATMVSAFLDSYEPERVQAIRDEYSSQIVAIETKIAALAYAVA